MKNKNILKPLFLYRENKIKIAFIGCGSVSYYHYDVLTALGIEVIAASARKNSTSLLSFTNKYKNVKPYDDYKIMIRNEKPDALFVLPSWDKVEQVLFDLREFDIPKLVEKPVSFSTTKIESLIEIYSNHKSNVLIGYNRRFYDFMPEIKKMLSEINISAVEIHIPESTNGISDPELITNLFIHNSSHVIDTFYYLLDEPEIHVENVKMLSYNRNKPKGYNAFLLANNIPVHLIANWNSPSNFGIKFHADNYLIELLPLEMVTTYNGFDIIEPTDENPIRRYIPKVDSRYFINKRSARFKPGFLNQAINFIETSVLCNYSNTEAATLATTLEVTRICSNIINGEIS